MTVEFGTIRFYDNRQGYGIIDVTDRNGTLLEEGVRFDLNGVRYWRILQDDVRFSAKPLRLHRPAQSFSKGTQLVFERTSKTDTRTCHWGFRSEFDGCVQTLADYYPSYVEAVVYVSGTNERIVVWSGTDVYDLSLQFDKGIYDIYKFEVTYGDYCTEYEWDGTPCEVSTEWTEDVDDPRVELCCIPAVYWQLHGPLGVPQPQCPHRIAE